MRAPAARRGAAEPPLLPAPDEARDELRRELLHPEYHDTDLVARLVRWLERVLGRGLQAASDVPALAQAAAVLLLMLLTTGVVLLISRARRSPRLRAASGPVLGQERLRAVELRARAEAALAAGRLDEAVVDGFRALAVRQVERGRIADAPGATAHEVAASLAAELSEQAPAVTAAADLFDAVLYGGRPATEAQVRSVLALDDALVVRR